MKSVVALAIVIGALLSASCGSSRNDDASSERETTTDTTDGGDVTPDSDPGTSAETTELGTGNGTFTVRHVALVDETRATSPEIPQRTLPTDIYIPGGDGPFPLVMHAHGMNGTSAKFSQLLGHWAEAGYAVVAPNFPRTNGDADDDLIDLGDYVNQPGDVTEVLDQVLAMNEPGGALGGLIAPKHIAISGLSLGGATTYPLLYHSCCIDERYVSGLLMSALELPFPEGAYDYSRHFPILTFSGTEDESIPYEMQLDTITQLAGPRWTVTFPGGHHALPYENDPSPQDDVVLATTVDFWDLTLRGDPGAAERLARDAAVKGTSMVEISP